MKITCQACGAKYAIADDKVRGRKVKVRCKGCSAPIVVDGTVPEPVDDSASAADEDEATRVVDTRGMFGSQPAPAADAWSVNLSDTEQRTMTTEELVAAHRDGALGQDAFVWKDGMADWLPLLEVPELAAALGAARAPAAAAFAPPPAPAFAPPPAPAFAPPTSAARVSGGRAGGGQDLFGNIDSAGSEHDAPAAAPSTPGSHAYDDKPTGARNENSVLFSLDALKAGVSAPRSPGAPPPRAASTGGSASFDDLMNLGGGGGGAIFGLGANQALLTAPPPPEPEPPPAAASVPPSWQAGSVAPAAPASKNKRIVIIGVAVAALVALGVGLGSLLGGKKSEPVAANDATASANDKPGSGSDKKDDSAPAAGDKKDDSAPAAGDKKDDSAPAGDGKGDAAAAAGDKDDPKAPVSDEDKKRYFEAQKKNAEKSAADAKEEPKKADDKVAVKENPSSGLASFDKGAAISALSSAASAATGCKRPDGPTGTGRAVVTFAPSGRVTSANVSGGEFGGSSVGGCVASVFRRAHVPPFSGNSVTVSKSFTIP
ncbi:MAG: zinc-ribbon domain-containing protein [Sorangiineae bacterium]|nr:zinc-ribbon domain-containing protein [Polyangiaceae bacterium]MEB2321871.1 zinc-ribbon domain-containing protein [Sorangiineae bacterium]